MKYKEPRNPGAGTDWFQRLYKLFAPAREEAVEKGYTEEEINQAIDEAVRQVRSTATCNA